MSLDSSVLSYLPILLVHCFDCIGQIHIGELFRILELQEAIASVTRQVNEHIALSVAKQTS